MKKYSARLLIIIIIVIFVFFFILLVVYNKNLCEIIYELCLALFTGCIFAIPSYIVIFFETKKKTKRNTNSIIKGTNDILSKIDCNNYDIKNRYNNEINQLIKLSLELSTMATDYYMDAKLVDNINSCIFQISSNYYKFNKEYDSLSEQERNNCINAITQSKNNCLDLLKNY